MCLKHVLQWSLLMGYKELNEAMAFHQAMSVHWTDLTFSFAVEESISSGWFEGFKAKFISLLMIDLACQRFFKGKQEIKQVQCYVAGQSVYNCHPLFHLQPAVWSCVGSGRGHFIAPSLKCRQIAEPFWEKWEIQFHCNNVVLRKKIRLIGSWSKG